ncbi:MAG: hypothetical protein D6820_08240, partial [Lentisphaerae bacterium]
MKPKRRAPKVTRRQKPLTRPNLIRSPKGKQIVKVLVGGKIQHLCIAPQSLQLKTNELCIIRHQYYEDLGRIVQLREWNGEELTEETPVVIRHASIRDQSRAHENEARAHTFERCAEKLIKEHNLPMNLVDTHLSFDRKFVIFRFTAPGRVDFRELLKDMHKEISARVE